MSTPRIHQDFWITVLFVSCTVYSYSLSVSPSFRGWWFSHSSNQTKCNSKLHVSETTKTLLTIDMSCDWAWDAVMVKNCAVTCWSRKYNHGWQNGQQIQLDGVKTKLPLLICLYLHHEENGCRWQAFSFNRLW